MAIKKSFQNQNAVEAYLTGTGTEEDTKTLIKLEQDKTILRSQLKLLLYPE